MRKDYLPIGSVVSLKNGKKKLMIIGFYAETEIKKKKPFDYIGVIYPEGMISSEKNLVFDHDQIEKVYSLGYVDIEEKAFRKGFLSIVNKK